MQKSVKCSLLVSVLDLPGREKKFLGCWDGCSASEKSGRGGCRWGSKMQQVRLILKQPECPHCLCLTSSSLLWILVLLYCVLQCSPRSPLILYLSGLLLLHVLPSLPYFLFFSHFSLSSFCLYLRSGRALYSVNLDSLERTSRSTEGQISPLQHPKLCWDRYILWLWLHFCLSEARPF